MARKTKTTAPVNSDVATQATDAYWIDPTTVKLGYNSRIVAEVDEKEQDILGAIDIYNAGQQQACVARKLEDGGVELVAGFGRLRKILLLRTGFEHHGVTYHKPDLKLLVRVDDSIKSHKDAFIASVRENIRKEVSALNVAKQQEVLRKDFGLSDTEVAQLYGYNNTNAIARFKKLLTTSEEVQKLVHTGELATDAALKLLELPKAKREELLAKAAAGEKLTGSVVAEAVNAYVEEREAKKAEKEAAGSEPAEAPVEEAAEEEVEAKRQPRNAAKLKKWIEEYCDRELDGEAIEDQAPLAYGFVKGLVNYLNGVGGDQALWNRFAKLLDNEAK